MGLPRALLFRICVKWTSTTYKSIILRGDRFSVWISTFSGGFRALKIKRMIEKDHLLPACFPINHYFSNSLNAWKTGAYYFSSFSELALSISWESCYFSNLTTSRTFPVISKKLIPNSALYRGRWRRGPLYQWRCAPKSQKVVILGVFSPTWVLVISMTLSPNSSLHLEPCSVPCHVHLMQISAE